jgi:hypothetical protein
MRRIHHPVVARAGRIVTVADLLELMAAVVSVQLRQVGDGRFITACHTRSITAR